MNQFCTKCYKTFPKEIMTQISEELGVCPDIGLNLIEQRTEQIKWSFQ